MDLYELQCIIAIAEEKNISKAAEKINITQSALNQRLLKLEKDLGTPLFERKKRQMETTYAGRIYLENANKIMQIKEETYKMISDIAQNKKGEISIAFTPERGAKMFNAIYPKFHSLYPEVTFKIFEARIKEMERLLLNGTVRIANVAFYNKNDEFETFSFGTEKMILGVPKSHPLAEKAGKESWKNFPYIDLSLFKDMQFVLNAEETLMHDMVKDAFRKAGFSPKILFESISSHTILEIIKNQIALGFFPQYYADKNLPIAYFSVGDEFVWTYGISYRKGIYLSEPEEALIDLMHQYHISLEK